MSNVKRTPKPTLDLPEKIADLIVLGLRVSAAGTDNAGLFVNPDPTPADVLAATQLLETANTATGSKTRGLVTARAPKEIALRNVLGAWGAYLVTVAAKNPGQEAYVYQTGGFRSRRPAQRDDSALRLTQPRTYPSGQVRAACKAAKKNVKAFYGWRISLDGGKSWATSQTNVHVTDFSGIPMGTTIEVQYNTTIKNVTSAWSGSKTLVVR
jgi:hypothetical protein